MSRLPFDPSRALGGKPVGKPAGSSAGKGGGGSDDTPYTPSGLAERLEVTLTNAFPGTLRVRGEVSNLRDRNHWYFDLKDSDAVVACVAWAATVRKLRDRAMGLDVEDGAEVIVSGRLGYYGPHGKLQLYVTSIQPVGRGALEAQLQARAEELKTLGYFDDAHKQSLPIVPQKIAIVTSRSAAALQDVIHTAQQRWPGVKLCLADVRVQGKPATAEIAAAIHWLSEHGAAQGIEAIIVTRGGGSMEDLWCFNEREVCDAVHHCTLPIVAAIGHETDTTLAELCADRRAATPTQAATLLVPDRRELTEQLRQTSDRLRLLVARRLGSERQRLTAIARHPLFRDPARLLESRSRELDQHARSLSRALPQRLTTESRRLADVQRRLQRVTATGPGSATDAAADRLARLGQRLESAADQCQATAARRADFLAARLQAISPQRVLARGFSYTLDKKGKPLRNAADAAPGDRLKTVLADGEVASVVQSPDGSAPVIKRRPRKRTDPTGPGLFEKTDE